MPKLTIEQKHSLPISEVKSRLQGLNDRLAEKYGIVANWTSEREADLKRTGVTGKITCTENVVSVFIDMSFALSPLKGKVEERVRQYLTECLA